MHGEYTIEIGTAHEWGYEFMELSTPSLLMPPSCSCYFDMPPSRQTSMLRRWLEARMYKPAPAPPKLPTQRDLDIQTAYVEIEEFLHPKIGNDTERRGA